MPRWSVRAIREWGIDMRNSVQLSARQQIMQAGFVILVSTAMILAAGCSFPAAGPAAAQEGREKSDWDPRDLGGIWQTSIRDITLGMLPGEEIAFTPYGAKKHKSFDLREYSQRGCENKGLTRQLLSNSLSMFVQDPKSQMMVVLHEDHNRWRAIYMDGRSHPGEVYDIPEPFGHSIGHWEGDTLVVDSVGFRDNTYLDTNGLGHSAQLHLTERFKRTGPDTIEWTTTVEDKLFYVHPFTFRSIFTREEGVRLMMYDCENEKDIEYLESVIRGDNEIHSKPEYFKFPK
jgi:hypothetical protein